MNIKQEKLDRGSYGEVFRQGIQFSLGILEDGVLLPLFPFTTCKDFLTDVIWSEKVNKPISIYSFSWSPSGVTEKNLHLIIKDDAGIPAGGEGVLEKTLNLWEEQLGFKKSQVLREGDLLIIELNSEWYNRPYMFALFTTLCSCYPIEQDFGDFDSFIEVASKYARRKNYFTTGMFFNKMKKIWNKEEINGFNEYNPSLSAHDVHYGLGLTELNV